MPEDRSTSEAMIGSARKKNWAFGLKPASLLYRGNRGLYLTSDYLEGTQKKRDTVEDRFRAAWSYLGLCADVVKLNSACVCCNNASTVENCDAQYNVCVYRVDAVD